MNASDIFSSLSKRDLSQLLDLVHSSMEITAETQLEELLDHVRNLIPCENIVSALGELNESFLFQGFDKIVNVSYPMGWATAYLEQGYEKVDPVLRSHFKRFKTQKWTDTFQKARTRREKEFINSARSFGLSKGITLGTFSPESRKWTIFSFSGPSIEEHDRHEDILEYLLPHFHQALIRTISSSPLTTPRISFREREVLNWMKKGKTSGDISQILKITERTVNFHVHNILFKLRATSRSHAVAIALREKIISY
ncbi:MAG: autoinducer binding domain-containing protein [Nitrospirae bacterium]|nr:autoinducer binding domain-containing protein [Nitrospirota bacterium]